MVNTASKTKKLIIPLISHLKGDTIIETKSFFNFIKSDFTLRISTMTHFSILHLSLK